VRSFSSSWSRRSRSGSHHMVLSVTSCARATALRSMTCSMSLLRRQNVIASPTLCATPSHRAGLYLVDVVRLVQCVNGILSIISTTVGGCSVATVRGVVGVVIGAGMKCSFLCWCAVLFWNPSCVWFGHLFCSSPFMRLRVIAAS